MVDVDETAANANKVRMDLEARFLLGLKNPYPGLRYAMEGAGKEQKESMADVVRGFMVPLFGSLPPMENGIMHSGLAVCLDGHVEFYVQGVFLSERDGAVLYFPVSVE